MANIFILAPDGSKTLVSKDQLVSFAQSGRITPESQIEVLGRVVAASKIKELKPYFDAFESSNSGTTLPTEEAPKQEAGSTPEEAANTDSSAQSSEGDIYDVVAPPSSSADSNVPPIGVSAYVPPTVSGVATSNTRFTSSPVESLEVSSIVDSDRVKRVSKKRLGFLFYFYWFISIIAIGYFVVVGLSYLGDYFKSSRQSNHQIKPVLDECSSCWSTVYSYKENPKGEKWSNVKKSLQKLFEIDEKKYDKYHLRTLEVRSALIVYESIDYSTKYFESARAAALEDLSDTLWDLRGELQKDFYDKKSLAKDELLGSLVKFTNGFAVWLLVYSFHRIVFLLLGNVIRREIYQMEQIKFQQKIVNALKSKAL